MEVTFSRKTVFWYAAIIILLVGGLIACFQWGNGLFSAWIAKSNTPSANEPAFSAVDSMFTPNISSGERAWEMKTCAGMTPDGCKLFENMYGQAIWGMASASKLQKTTFTYAGVAQEVSGTNQVWKLSTSNTMWPWLYIEVTQDPKTHQWVLERILFDQEAQARYGSK